VDDAAAPAQEGEVAGEGAPAAEGDAAAAAAALSAAPEAPEPVMPSLGRAADISACTPEALETLSSL
jgi:hypothetical protein